MLLCVTMQSLSEGDGDVGARTKMDSERRILMMAVDECFFLDIVAIAKLAAPVDMIVTNVSNVGNLYNKL